jgi:hypothetical protein
VVASLAWAVVGPAMARGLGLVGQAVGPVLEADRRARYEVAGDRVLVHRPVTTPRSGRALIWTQPLWVASQNFGPALLAALVWATPGWSWGRRSRALAVGLGLLLLTQVAHFLVSIEATQHSPVPTPDGPLYLPGYSPDLRPVWYALWYFFEIMGRGFFALLAYLGLVAVWWGPRPTRGAPAPRRNDACPCGSGLKWKRCCGAS